MDALDWTLLGCSAALFSILMGMAWYELRKR